MHQKINSFKEYDIAYECKSDVYLKMWKLKPISLASRISFIPFRCAKLQLTTCNNTRLSTLQLDIICKFYFAEV